MSAKSTERKETSKILTRKLNEKYSKSLVLVNNKQIQPLRYRFYSEIYNIIIYSEFTSTVIHVGPQLFGIGWEIHPGVKFFNESTKYDSH